MTNVFRLRATSWIAPALLSLACGSPSLPGPKLAPHSSKDLLPVDYPPPPARAEIVPPQPDGEVVWVDGEWAFRGKKWRWRRGRWVELSASRDLRFAPWTSVRSDDGQLYVAEGRWVDARGNEVEAPRVVREAAPSKAMVVNEQGETEDVGRDLREPRDGGARVRERGEERDAGGEP